MVTSATVTHAIISRQTTSHGGENSTFPRIPSTTKTHGVTIVANRALSLSSCPTGFVLTPSSESGAPGGSQGGGRSLCPRLSSSGIYFGLCRARPLAFNHHINCGKMAHSAKTGMYVHQAPSPDTPLEHKDARTEAATPMKPITSV